MISLVLIVNGLLLFAQVFFFNKNENWKVITNHIHKHRINFFPCSLAVIKQDFQQRSLILSFFFLRPLCRLVSTPTLPLPPPSRSWNSLRFWPLMDTGGHKFTWHGLHFRRSQQHSKEGHDRCVVGFFMAKLVESFFFFATLSFSCGLR